MFIGWLTCIPAVLLPHSLCRSTTANAPANRQMPIASVVRWHSKKRKKTDLLLKNLWRTVRFYDINRQVLLSRICSFSGFWTADNSSQILKERKLDLLLFRLRHITNESVEMEISDLNIRKPSSLLLTLLFSGLKVVNEQAWRKEKTNSLTTRKKRKPVSGCRENA